MIRRYRMLGWVVADVLVVGALVYAVAPLGAGGQEPPNGYNVVLAVNAAYPGLIASNTTEFTDRVCQALAQLDPRWGRKARAKGDAASRNADALAYKFSDDDADKALVDIVTASESPAAAPSWQVYPAPTSGNGFWIQCPAVEQPPTPAPCPSCPPPVSPDAQVVAQLAALEREIVQLHAAVDALAARPEPTCGPIAWPDYTTKVAWIKVVLHPNVAGK